MRFVGDSSLAESHSNLHETEEKRGPQDIGHPIMLTIYVYTWLLYIRRHHALRHNLRARGRWPSALPSRSDSGSAAVAPVPTRDT